MKSIKTKILVVSILYLLNTKSIFSQGVITPEVQLHKPELIHADYDWNLIEKVMEVKQSHYDRNYARLKFLVDYASPMMDKIKELDMYNDNDAAEFIIAATEVMIVYKSNDDLSLFDNKINELANNLFNKEDLLNSKIRAKNELNNTQKNYQNDNTVLFTKPKEEFIDGNNVSIVKNTDHMWGKTEISGSLITLPANATVKLISRIYDYWKVEFNGKVGWLNERNLEVPIRMSWLKNIGKKE